jgi:phytoene dehydrogenase-like protein
VTEFALRFDVRDIPAYAARFQEVRSATRTALARNSTERERMRVLRALHGVQWPTASVLLHLADPDRWPILDVRALHALGVRGRVSYSYGFWEDYVEAFRRLVTRAGVDGRTLDRGL